MKTVDLFIRVYFYCFSTRFILYRWHNLFSDPTFFMYPNDSKILSSDTGQLSCRVRSYGNKKVNIIVQMTDEQGHQLASEQHSLLNNFTVVQREVNLTSSVYRAFCHVTVVNMSSVSKILSVTRYHVLGKSYQRISNFSTIACDILLHFYDLTEPRDLQ